MPERARRNDAAFDPDAARLARVEHLFDPGQAPKTAQTLRARWRRNSDDPQLTIELAIAEAAADNFVEAIRLLERVRPLVAPNASATAGRLVLGLLVACVRDNGDPQRALELLAPVHFKRRRTLGDAEQRCLGMRAVCNLDLGRRALARREFERLGRANPNHPLLTEPAVKELLQGKA